MRKSAVILISLQREVSTRTEVLWLS